MYGGFRKFVNSPGTDGTVRMAGAALNARKFDIDLTRPVETDVKTGDQRIRISKAKPIDCPLWPIDGLTHGTILSAPTPELQDLVASALDVNSKAEYDAWFTRADQLTSATRAALPQWQQFIAHAVDERGDPIPDYQIEIYNLDTGEELDLQLDPDIYRNDTSFRSYHVDVKDLVSLEGRLEVKIVAKSGSTLVDYRGEGSEKKNGTAGLWDAKVRVTTSAEDGQRFFQPFTTTLIQLVLNRDPKPFDEDRVRLCYFGEWQETRG